jgi:hypothetical protein
MTSTALQGATWNKALQPQIAQMANSGHYNGSEEERQAQALRDMANHAAEGHDLASLTLGAMLLVIRNRKLYERLGYSSMREFLQGEKVGNVGKTQLYKYMSVAEITPPGQINAAPLGVMSTLDTSIPRPVLTPGFVAAHGIEKAYAVSQRWEDSTKDQREEMKGLLESPDPASSRELYRVAYGKPDQASFLVQGDEIVLFQDELGTPVAQLLTPDPEVRRLLMDRLNMIPRARL